MNLVRAMLTPLNWIGGKFSQLIDGFEWLFGLKKPDTMTAEQAEMYNGMYAHLGIRDYAEAYLRWNGSGGTLAEQ